MNSFFFGPHSTPKSIKRIIYLLVISALVIPVLAFFLNSFKLKNPLDFLPLSLLNFKKGYYFELLTYPFISSAKDVISLSLLWHLTFQIFIFWFVGSELLLRIGGKKFSFLLLSSILVPAFAFLLFQFIIKDTTLLFGIYPPLFSLLTVLALEVGILEISFLLFFRFRLRNLLFLFLGISLLMTLSHGEYSLFFTKITAICWGFLFSKLSLKLPVFSQKKSDCEIIEVSEWRSKEDAFVDQMLDKIAQKGRASLTEEEKEKLDRITKKKD